MKKFPPIVTFLLTEFTVALLCRRLRHVSVSCSPERRICIDTLSPQNRNTQRSNKLRRECLKLDSRVGGPRGDQTFKNMSKVIGKLVVSVTIFRRARDSLVSPFVCSMPLGYQKGLPLGLLLGLLLDPLLGLQLSHVWLCTSTLVSMMTETQVLLKNLSTFQIPLICNVFSFLAKHTITRRSTRLLKGRRQCAPDQRKTGFKCILSPQRRLLCVCSESPCESHCRLVTL